MSRRATDWAWTTTAKGGDLLVLLALADWANKDTDQCNPKVEQVAEKTGLSVSTARRSLRVLESSGLIKTNISSGGRHMRSTYTLAVVTRSDRPGLGDDETGRSDDRNPVTVTDKPSQTDRVTAAKPGHSDAETRSQRPLNPVTVTDVVPKTSHKPVSEPRARNGAHINGRAAVLDDSISNADVQNAERIVDRNVGVQPRPARHELTTIVAGCLSDGIAESVIVTGLSRWCERGRRAASLSDFIAEELRRAPVKAPVFDSPRDHLASLWKTGDAVTVAKLIGGLWFDPAQPPSDHTPADEWLLKRRREYIEAHRDAAIKALAARESRTA